jgi:hypothetical protein
MLCNDARHSWLTDVIEASHFGTRLPARDNAFGNLTTLRRIKFLSAAAYPSFRAGDGDSG